MKKLDNFQKSVKNLKEVYKYEPPYDVVDLTGLVGLFQLCFELSWKTMKEYLTEEGFPAGATGSPRTIIKSAYQAGIITDQDVWLSMLADRNDTSHEYDIDVAETIIDRVRESYYPELEKLLEKFVNRPSEIKK